MLERASVLRRNYEELLLTCLVALTTEDKDWLKQELETLKEHHESLQSVLGRHSDWQRMHDQLEELDHFKDLADSFTDQLEFFFWTTTVKQWIVCLPMQTNGPPCE